MHGTKLHPDQPQLFWELRVNPTLEPELLLDTTTTTHVIPGQLKKGFPV
jgi:hypothetical protein